MPRTTSRTEPMNASALAVARNRSTLPSVQALELRSSRSSDACLCCVGAAGRSVRSAFSRNEQASVISRSFLIRATWATTPSICRSCSARSRASASPRARAASASSRKPIAREYSGRSRPTGSTQAHGDAGERMAGVQGAQDLALEAADPVANRAVVVLDAVPARGHRAEPEENVRLLDEPRLAGVEPVVVIFQERIRCAELRIEAGHDRPEIRRDRSIGELELDREDPVLVPVELVKEGRAPG